ncbi:MAG: endonuclease domain-containing protein, partial [Parvibaculaceae bacterium]
PPERRLWTALRLLKASGFHFRRQAPIGPYVVDFVCLSARLVVESDGLSHATAEAAAHDGRRDAFLRREGFRLLRVSHGEVLANPEGVVETVLRELGHAR